MKGRVWRALAWFGIVEPVDGQAQTAPRRAVAAPAARTARARAEASPRPPRAPAVSEVPRVAPSRFEDAGEVLAALRRGQSVIVDIGHLDAPYARRMLDFVSGIAYTAGARLHAIGPRQYELRAPAPAPRADEPHPPAS